MPDTVRLSGLTGRPAFRSSAKVADCVGAGHSFPAARALHLPHLVGPERQGPGGRDGRVLLAQRAGGGVAGVHEQPLAGGLLAGVHGGEVGQGHVDLAPDLEQPGVWAGLGVERVGHGLDRGHVGRHVLAGHPVAPGGGLDEAPLLVGQRHGHAVDLGLAGEGQMLQVELGDLAAQALGPGPQVRLLEGVVEAHHGTPVPDGLEQPRGRRADRLRGRVGGDERRVGGLEVPSSRTNRSYSASGISGASSTW